MEAIEMFGEEVTNAVTSTAVKHLPKINENYVQLNEHRSDLFQPVTA